MHPTVPGSGHDRIPDAHAGYDRREFFVSGLGADRRPRKRRSGFFALLFVGRLIIRPSFRYIASLHSSELFMLAVLVASVGAAKFAQMMGLSLALGGFMAGMVLGETEFRHQVEADIRPFQDVLLGLFFITIGILVDWEILVHIWLTVLAVTAGIVLIKATLVFALTKVMGVTAATAIRTGIILAHGGEFSLMLLFLALQMGMLQGEVGQIMLIAVLLSMVMAPILIRYSTTFSERLSGVSLHRTQQGLVKNIETAARNLSSHVILCGYGRVGRNVAWFLEEENVEYVAVDLELNRLHGTVEGGQRVTYGDATRRHILVAAGIERAQAIVITFDDVRGALKTLSQIHELRPDITAIVRATDEQHLEELLDVGATEVISDTLETSLTMAAHVLTLLGVPVAKVAERSDRMHADRYRLLRGVLHAREQVHDRDRVRKDRKFNRMCLIIRVGACPTEPVGTAPLLRFDPPSPVILSEMGL
jgi:CPA2 family monovalent cation:H+ antiporter-2